MRSLFVVTKRSSNVRDEIVDLVASCIILFPNLSIFKLTDSDNRNMLFKNHFFTSSFNWRLFWILEISRQPIIFRDGSISTFDRHVKLYSSTKFHAFNQNSHNPCTYPPHYRFRLAKEQLCMWNRLLWTFLSHCYTTATWYLISKPNIMHLFLRR